MSLSDEKKYWIAFSHVRGFGALKFTKLLDHFESLQQAWFANISELAAAGLSQINIRNLFDLKKTIDIDNILHDLDTKNINVMFSDDLDYPIRLREIDQQPPVLYYIGSITKQDALSVGVVGARKVSTYGKRIASELGWYCADHGITIVSGLARGVDAAAHHEALRAGGRTLAVLGSGVDVIYPPEHRALAEKITENGAIISEYPPGTKPDRGNFPPRNRIISGLSQAVVIVEAGERSGSLITAEFAADQGREVFAVPGPIVSPTSFGTNKLIKDGANILTAYKDILDLLNINSDRMSGSVSVQLDESEKKILDKLDNDSMSTDDLFKLCGMDMEKFMAVLTMLELKGIVDLQNGRVNTLKKIER